MQCLPEADAVQCWAICNNSMTLSCMKLFSIAMSILPDLCYSVQGAALPFEHLLTAIILNANTKHYCSGLEPVKQIKWKLNISYNYLSFQYWEGGGGWGCCRGDWFRLMIFFFFLEQVFFFLKWSSNSQKYCWNRDVKNFWQFHFQ